MGRLCGGAHEISGIKASLFSVCGWLEGSWGGWWWDGWLVGCVGDGVGGGRVGLVVRGLGGGVGGKGWWGGWVYV